MEKSNRIFLLFPLMEIIYFILLSLYIGILFSKNSYYNELIDAIILPAIILIIIKIITLTIYVYFIIENKEIKEQRQILWILSLICIGNLMMLIYWYIYLRNNRIKRHVI